MNTNDVKKRDGIRDFRKCPKHNVWLKKGWCIQCDNEERRAKYLQEQLTGSNKQEIKITKI